MTKAAVSKSVLESGALTVLLPALLLRCFLLLWLYLLMLMLLMLNCR